LDFVDTHDEMLTNKRRGKFETNLISCSKTNKVVKQSLSEIESEDSTLLQPDVNIAHQEIMIGNNHNSVHACDNLYKKLNEELRT
jgi:hypothetical protein